MNAKNLLTALLTTVAASGAFAQFNGEATYEYPVATGSTTTRAQVTSEYFAARDAGQIRDGETGYVADPSQGSTAVARSREAVKAETVQANARGELAAFNGEASYEYPQPSYSARSREDVRNETVAYMRSQRNAN